MNQNESESVRIAIGRMDTVLLKIAETNKRKELLERLIVQPSTFQTGEELSIRICSTRNDVSVCMNTGTPHFNELFQLLLRVLVQAQTERLAVLKDLLLTESGGLAPLLGLQRMKLSDLDLPAELIRPRVIEPFTEEESS